MKPESEADKFFNNLPSEKAEPDFQFFEPVKAKEPNEEKEEAQEETKPEKEEDSEEQPEKRPNRQERRQERNKFFEEQLAKKDTMLEQLQTELLRRNQSDSKEEVDTRLTRLFGDTPEGKEASRIVSELLKETEERAVAPYRELTQSQREEAESEARFGEQISEGLATVEDTFGIDLTSRTSQKVRAEFLDFVDELSPEDSLVNFPKAWELFQSNQKAPRDMATIERKKEIASRSIQRSSPARPDVTKLEPMSFDKVETLWGKMFG